MSTVHAKVAIGISTAVMGMLSSAVFAEAKPKAASQIFPKAMRASWAEELSSCEPEFTRGIDIGAREISYYDGPAKLLSLGPVNMIKTPLGLGLTVIARLREYEGGESHLASSRLTVVGKWLYKSQANDPIAKHLSAKNRMVRCPPGSTD